MYPVNLRDNVYQNFKNMGSGLGNWNVSGINTCRSWQARNRPLHPKREAGNQRMGKYIFACIPPSNIRTFKPCSAKTSTPHGAMAHWGDARLLFTFAHGLIERICWWTLIVGQGPEIGFWSCAWRSQPERSRQPPTLAKLRPVPTLGLCKGVFSLTPSSV